jgi:hypothetical protein
MSARGCFLPTDIVCIPDDSIECVSSYILDLGDPWREATMSASTQNLQSTPLQPILISDGFHTSDLGIANGKVDASVGEVQKEALKYFSTWISQWNDLHSGN